MLLSFLTNTFAVLMEIAPWFLLGLVFAGLVRWLLPDKRLARLLGTGGVNTVARATILGAPLPLCSCGVLPTAIGLRRQGLSKPGTVSFLVATPQNGVDSIAVTYALLGPVFTVVRLVTSLVSAFTAGVATLLVDRPKVEQAAREEATTSCGCSSNADIPEDPGAISLSVAAAPASCCSRAPAPEPAPASCCSSGPAAQSSCCSASAPAKASFLDGQRYAFGKLFTDLAPWLALGVAVAGLMNTLFSPGDIAAWGSGLLPMLAVVAVSIPLYVCASASTPIAASLLAAGASPGVALAFLLVGPATNFAGVALINKELGYKVTATYLVSLTVTTLALGLGADALAGPLNLTASIDEGQGSHLVPMWLAYGATAALLVLTLKLSITDLRGAARDRSENDASPRASAANA